MTVHPSKLNFVATPFRPHPLMTNPHIQTLAGEFFRKTKRQPPFRRVRLDTPDDDFVDVDFVEIEGQTWSQLGDDAPILYLLHGLEGDARRGYAIDLYQSAAQAGYRCVGINYRSCSGEMNRQPFFYHMGATGDVGLVLDYLLETYPDAPIFMVGVSLGGNILLKFLGEQSESLSERVAGGAAISPVFIATGKQKISDDPIGRLYGNNLLSRLKKKVRLKAHDLMDTPADPYRALTAKTIREFDDAITAPLHGFTDSEDYYAQSNSVNFLDGIRRPTLLLRAYDDPFFNRDIPLNVIERNQWLVGLFPENGGHVGFVEGLSPLSYTNWAQTQTIRFFDSIRELL
ncbi:MAG: alpha/beta fold hydrolase [Chloroflexota bacterium]